MGRFGREAKPENPLYVRWMPPTCPYALEMRLELITHLKADLETAFRAGTKLSGLFIGELPSQESPTLRLDGVVSSLAEQLFGMPAVGYFSSRLPDEELAPTAAETQMLAQRFPAGIYAFMAVSASAPRQGAFFLAVGGQLAQISSTGVFAFEESSFAGLPEIAPETSEVFRSFSLERFKGGLGIPWPAVLSVASLVCLIGWWIFGARLSQTMRPVSNQMNLRVAESGANLKVTWDHSAPVVASSLGADIVITDGDTRREVHLNSEDLRLGQLACEHLTGQVTIVVHLDLPGSAIPLQTIDWHAG